MSRCRQLINVLGLVTVGLTFGAGCLAPRIEDRATLKTAQHVDRIQRFQEKWGTITASDLLIVPNKGQFELNYSKGTGEYVDKARTGYQGAARRSFERAFDQQSAVQTSFDVNEFIRTIQTIGPKSVEFSRSVPPSEPGTIDATGETSFISTITPDNVALGAGDTDISFERGEVAPSTKHVSSKLPIDNPAQGVLSSDQFTAPLTLAAPPTEISERRALLIGVNDKLTEMVLNQLASPKFTAKNAKVFLAYFTVSCTPGWKTRRGYIADISIGFEFARDWTELDKEKEKLKPGTFTDYELEFLGAEKKKSRALAQEKNAKVENGENQVLFNSELHGGSRATVLSIFPLLEAQTLDLRNSERDQVALANYVSSLMMGLGANQMAENMTSYAQRLEYDAATRSPIPIVHGYSDSFSLGFRFMPAFQALADPADSKRGSDHILQPYSMPAVALIVTTEKEAANWDYIVPVVRERWIPLKRDQEWWKFRALPRRQSMKLQVAYANELDRAIAAFDKIDPDGEHFSETGRGVLDAHIFNLQNMGNTWLVLKDIPEGDKAPVQAHAPTIDLIYPADGWSNADSFFVVEGTGFMLEKQSIVKSVTIGGRPCNVIEGGTSQREFPVLDAVGNPKHDDEGKPIVERKSVDTLVVIVRKWPQEPANVDANGEHMYIATTGGIAQSRQRITFNKRVATPGPAPTIEIERNSAGEVVKIVVRAADHVSGNRLMDAVQDILKHQGIEVDVELGLEGAS